MGHRAEKQMYGSPANANAVRKIPKRECVEPGWKAPKIGKRKEGDGRLNGPRFWKPRHHHHAAV